jgi:hypothetical protein
VNPIFLDPMWVPGRGKVQSIMIYIMIFLAGDHLHAVLL